MLYRHARLALVASALLVTGLAAQSQSGWTELLAGGDLNKHFTTEGNWKLEDGVVSLTPRPGESGWTRYGSYLWAKQQYKDFEVEFDYKVKEKGNSGFYFHVGDVKQPVSTGIEVQIYDRRPGDVKLNDHDSGGIIPGIPPTKAAAKPAGEWNHFHIHCKDGRVKVQLNGELVNDVTIAEHEKLKSRPISGAIGFQDHALPISLKNIKIRAL